ncbi:MAG: response regulator [Gammaproteobacteria bacterium]|nr:response regulator [Gammaproteobacteria bacterium]
MNELKGCFKCGTNAVIALLLMTALVVALLYVRFVGGDLGRGGEVEQHKRVLLWEMELAVRDRALQLNAMLLLEDPFEREDRYEKFLSRAQGFMIAWRHFWKLSLSAKEQRTLEVLNAAAWRSSLLQRELIDLLQMEQQGEAKRRFLAEMVSAQQQVFSAIEELMQLIQRSSQSRLTQATMEYRWAEFFIVLLILLLFAAGALIVWKVRRNLIALQHSVVEAKKEAEVALQKQNQAETLLERVQSESVPASALVSQGVEQSMPSSDVSVAEHSDLRILVAEDNLVNQQVVALMLEQLGYADDRVDLVANGVEVLHAVESAVYDLIFMDLQMPMMGGEEATRKIISRYPIGSRPRIVAMTANALKGDRERCLSLGMDGYLSKPISLSKLSVVLEQMPYRCGVGMPVCDAVDVAALEALRADMVDGALVLVELLNNFFSESKYLLSSLHQAQKKGDYEKMGHAVHTLKSSSLSLGATALSERCRILEQQIRQDKVVELSIQIEAIGTEYRRVCEDFNALLGYYGQL